ncbi:MAG: transcription termination factor Rho, partial [Mycobacterium sp.]|nr:transcription termination factor Rho [Mycobacterium sp.]
MTEADLITADGSSDKAELPNTVNSEFSSPAKADVPLAAPPAEAAPTAEAASSGRGGALTTLVLPELRAMAKEIGVEGASGMRKSELISAIRERRGESNGRPREDASASAPATETPVETGSDDRASDVEQQAPPRRERRGASRNTGAPGAEENKKQDKGDAKSGGGDQQDDQQGGRNRGGDQQDDPQGDQQGGRNRGGGQQGDQQGGQNRGGNNNNDDDGDGDGDGRGGRRGRRFRDRRRRERGGEGGGGGDRDRDTELREDDVVQPVAGILDVLDNYAFVRTSGYLAGPNDVYVSMNMVRKNGLRRGDAVTGAVRVPKEGEGGGQNPRQKFNPLVRLDTVNGGPVDAAKNRPDFNKLTPLYPNQRLRLETTPEKLTTRVIDLILPIGKGQRALIVSPPKAGKTTIMQDIANGVAVNNPECHLMVVLVDERPEEVTDMQRSVKG